MAKALEASIALEGLLARVQTLVLFEMMLVLERLAAILVGARVRPILARVTLTSRRAGRRRLR